MIILISSIPLHTCGQRTHLQFNDLEGVGSANNWDIEEVLLLFELPSLYNNYPSQPPKINMEKTTSQLALTPNAIELLAMEAEQNILVQVINLKKMKTTNRISCELSDGHYKIRAYITDDKANQNYNLAFIQIRSYGMLSQSDKVVGVVVHDCRLIDRYVQVFGEPVDYIKDKNNLKISQDRKLIIDSEKLESNPAKKTKTNGNHVENMHPNTKNGLTAVPLPLNTLEAGSSKPIIKTPQKKQDINVTEAQSTSGKHYEKISDLYPDFPNWQILVRLVKKNYREFISGKGKPTKVLNVELMDSTGCKITGALFGDSAKQHFDALRQNEVYQVSKGQIRQDQYFQSKGKNFSKHTLMFTKQSQFRHCSNSDLLPQHQTNLKDLHTISENRKIGEQYDAVGVLIGIQEQVEIPKQGKTLYKQALEICDPINELVMEAVIWNRHIKVDDRILNKTVGLFGFRLNQYQEKLSLNSSYQSEIRVLEDHAYKKYQGKVQKQKMEVLSQKKDKAVEIQEPCKNLKELQNQIVYLESGKELRSTLTLILTLISYKNWSYESCPHCRKSAESSTRCGNCDRYIQETVPKFKLNVELSDYCGSIWATGFQQLGNKLFSDYPDGIKGIKSLQESERHRLFEKKQFQEFTVKLNSRHDRDGGIKHTVNRIYDCNIMNKISDNIKRIKNHQQ